MAHLERLSADQARNLMSQVRAAAPPVIHNLAVVRDLEFNYSGSPVRLRFYDALATREEGPIVVYFHGGGFVLGDLESHHALCVAIATGLSLPLVSVDYRLAPEHPGPPRRKMPRPRRDGLRHMHQARSAEGSNPWSSPAIAPVPISRP